MLIMRFGLNKTGTKVWDSHPFETHFSSYHDPFFNRNFGNLAFARFKSINHGMITKRIER